MPYTEKGAVEDFIIQELQKLGWKYIPAREMNALRDGELDQPLLTKFLKDAIRKINRNFSLTDSDLDSIIRTLNNIPPNLEGIRRLLNIIFNAEIRDRIHRSPRSSPYPLQEAHEEVLATRHPSSSQLRGK